MQTDIFHLESRKTGSGLKSRLLAKEFWRQARPRTGSGIGHTAKAENAA
jgi:hypothetical protein